MMFILSAKCESYLELVHPDLVRVVRSTARNWPDDGTIFRITCGARTLDEQKRLVAVGASRTLKSRHIIAPNGYSHAVDFCVVVDGLIKWDWPLYEIGAEHFKKSATAENVPIEWGGDWTSFKDGPHIQLPWAEYPGTTALVADASAGVGEAANA